MWLSKGEVIHSKLGIAPKKNLTAGPSPLTTEPAKETLWFACWPEWYWQEPASGTIPFSA